MTVAREQVTLAERRAAAARGAVSAIREAAATLQVVALTYEGLASSATAATPHPAPPVGLVPEVDGDWAAWARARAERNRREAQLTWARAAALETAAR